MQEPPMLPFTRPRPALPSGLPDIEIYTRTLPVAGLTKELRLFQVSDAHLLQTDERDGEQELKLAAHRRTVFQLPGANGTETVFFHLLKEGKRLRPDAFLFTGDMLDFPSPANIAHLQSELRGLASLYVTGNHDWGYLFLPETEQTRAAHLPRLAPFSAKDFSVHEYNGIRLLLLDNSLYQVSAKQLEQFQAELAKGPCVLACHIPFYAPALEPDVVSIWGTPIMVGTPRERLDLSREWDNRVLPAAETAEFTRLVNSHKNLRAVIAGHLHFPHSHLLAGGKPQFVNPPGYTGRATLYTLVPA